jgi:hypothetical protein
MARRSIRPFNVITRRMTSHIVQLDRSSNDVVQRSLLDESIDADIEAIALDRAGPEAQAAPRCAAGILPTPTDRART